MSVIDTTESFGVNVCATSLHVDWIKFSLVFRVFVTVGSDELWNVDSLLFWLGLQRYPSFAVYHGMKVDGYHIITMLELNKKQIRRLTSDACETLHSASHAQIQHWRKRQKSVSMMTATVVQELYKWRRRSQLAWWICRISLCPALVW